MGEKTSKKLQMSESIELAIFLALSGGLMDAYSYLARGEVFANAQTGNMLLFGVNAAHGDWFMAKRYAFPVISFALGIALAQLIRIKTKKRLHWRQVALIIEIILLIIVAHIPKTYNEIANALTSLACGIQVQAFRTIHGRGFSTTMCIGNLRSATHEAVEYISTKNKYYLKGSFLHFFTIFCFVGGAIIGSKLLGSLGLKTILISPILLSIATLAMFIDREKELDEYE